MSSAPSTDGKQLGGSGGGFDAMVVGSGPGGATVARELTRRGWRVLILEWGGKEPVSGSSWQAFRELGFPGRSLFLTGQAIAVVRGVTTGGSSIYFYGTAFDPPLEMLRSHGIDIAAEVAEVKRELGIAPLPPELIGPLATRIMESARDLGFAWNPLPKFLRQNRLGGGPVMGFYEAPAYEAKWNARMFVDEAIEGGATLVTHARVRRVLIEDGAAVGVEFTKAGATERAFARHVIVAAGGIGSPVILRASGLESAGYEFFYDPLICALGSVRGLKGEQELPMQAGALLHEEGYMLTDMMVPRSLYTAMTAQVGRLDRLPAYRSTLQIMIKVRDDLSGRLTHRGGIRKPLSRADRDRLESGYRRAREILANAGAKHIYRNWYTASHPGGTVKVGDLLDADLRTEYADLYVCDASVIPEPWGRPPVLTLIALAKRLAKHLAGSEPEEPPDTRAARRCRRAVALEVRGGGRLEARRTSARAHARAARFRREPVRDQPGCAGGVGASAHCGYPQVRPEPIPGLLQHRHAAGACLAPRPERCQLHGARGSRRGRQRAGRCAAQRARCRAGRAVAGRGSDLASCAGVGRCRATRHARSPPPEAPEAGRGGRAAHPPPARSEPAQPHWRKLRPGRA